MYNSPKGTLPSAADTRKGVREHKNQRQQFPVQASGQPLALPLTERISLLRFQLVTLFVDYSRLPRSRLAPVPVRPSLRPFFPILILLENLPGFRSVPCFPIQVRLRAASLLAIAPARLGLLIFRPA